MVVINSIRLNFNLILLIVRIVVSLRISNSATFSFTILNFTLKPQILVLNPQQIIIDLNHLTNLADQTTTHSKRSRVERKIACEIVGVKAERFRSRSNQVVQTSFFKVTPVVSAVAKILYPLTTVLR